MAETKQNKKGENDVVQIPTSGNLKDIAADMRKLNEFTKSIAPIIVDWSKSVIAFSKIDTGELISNARNVKDISKGIDIFVDSVGVLMNGLNRLTKDLDLKDIADLRSKLLTTESGGDTVTMKNIESKGNSALDLTKEIIKAKISNPGLIDIVAQVANLSGIMTSLKFANPVKFKLKFNHTLKLFEWQYKKLVIFSSAFDVKTIRTIKFATDGMQEVMMSLPSAVAAMTDLFVKYGSLRKRMLVKGGIKTLLGEQMNGTGGVAWSILLLGEQMNDNTLNPEAVNDFEKTVGNISKAISTFAGTLTMVCMTGKFITTGIRILFGTGKGKHSRGVIGVMITGLEWVSNKSKAVQNAEKSLLYVALAILALSTAIAMMIIAGALVVAGWKQIAIVTVFMVALVGVFMLVGLASRWIHEGGKELFYIAATVGILTLTAVLVVLLGNFIAAQWNSILQVGVMLIFLVGAFIAVGWAARWINNGAKELFFIALTVGILALIAVGLVFISNYIQGNWDGITQIGVMLLFLCGSIIAIGLLHKQLAQGHKSMILVIICAAALVLLTYFIAKIAETGDLLKMLATVGIMNLIVVAIGGIAFAAGALITGPQALLFAAGVLALGTLTLIGLGLANVLKSFAKAKKMSEEVGLKSADDIKRITNIVFDSFIGKNGIFAKISEMPNAFKIFAYSLRVKRLASIVRSIGRMAKTLADIATLKIPMEFDKDGNPTAWTNMKADDFKNAAINTGTIMAFVSAIFGEKKKRLPNGIIVGGLLKNVENVKRKHRRKMKRLDSIVTSIGNMATTLQNVASLRIPVEFDKNGKPTAWVTMGTNHFKMASDNVALIATTLIGAIASEELTQKLEDMDSDAAENFEHIMVPIGNLSSIMDIVKQLGEDKYVKTWKTDKDGNQVPSEYGSFTDLLKNAPNIKKNMMMMIDTIISPLSLYNSGEYEDMLDDAEDIIDDIVKVINGGSDITERLVKLYSDTIKDIDAKDFESKFSSPISIMNNMVKTIAGEHININKAEQFRQNIVEVDKLITKVNNVNLDKLKTASDLMKHISELSQSIRGNFEGLAKAINEDLLDALKKLTEIIDEINKKEFNVQTTNTTTVAGNIINKPTGSAGVKDKRELPKNINQLTKADIDNITKAIKDLTTKVSSVIDNGSSKVNIIMK